jgi:hypothetical protein
MERAGWNIDLQTETCKPKNQIVNTRNSADKTSVSQGACQSHISKNKRIIGFCVLQQAVQVANAITWEICFWRTLVCGQRVALERLA